MPDGTSHDTLSTTWSCKVKRDQLKLKLGQSATKVFRRLRNRFQADLICLGKMKVETRYDCCVKTLWVMDENSRTPSTAAEGEQAGMAERWCFFPG